MADPRRVLVTGAGGFVGANLVRRLLGEGAEVHGVVRAGGDRWRLADLGSDVNLIELDLVHAEGVQRLLHGLRPQRVFHLAAYGAYPDQGDFAAAVHVNLAATLNLAHACLQSGVEVLVNAGSSSEYGPASKAAAEGDGLDPRGPYASTKAASSLLLRHLSRAYDLPIVTLRIYSAFGPFEAPTRLIPTLITRGLRGALPELASPSTARDFVHVDDVCEAFVRAGRDARGRGDIFNVGSGRQRSLEQVVATARQLLGIEAEPRWRTMSDRVWDTDVWVADASLIASRLGWTPRLSFEEGFKSTITWFQENPRLRPRYETQAA